MICDLCDLHTFLYTFEPVLLPAPSWQAWQAWQQQSLYDTKRPALQLALQSLWSIRLTFLHTFELVFLPAQQAWQGLTLQSLRSILLRNLNLDLDLDYIFLWSWSWSWSCSRWTWWTWWTWPWWLWWPWLPTFNTLHTFNTNL